MIKQPRFALPADCKLILEEVRSKSSDYSRIWRDRVQGESLEVAISTIRSRIDPERPYFFGQLSNGIRFAGDARDFPAALHAMYPDCNSTLINALISEVGDREGDIIDVGANIGVVGASLARQIGARGHLHAFEPSPESFKMAAATMALNNLENVTVAEAALGDTDGDITFHATPGNSAIASSYRHGFPLLNEWAEIIVPSRRIDTLLREGAFKNVTLIKVDVEGSEMRVLGGAKETIRRFRPMVVYEYTPVAAASHGWTDRDSISLLEQLAPFRFDAVVEPPLDAFSSVGRRVSFPLPQGLGEQVNVFARPC
jgi:FkbM family methyltransferase